MNKLHTFKLIIGFFFLLFYVGYLEYKFWKLKSNLEKTKLFINLYCKKRVDIVMDKNYLPYEEKKESDK